MTPFLLLALLAAPLPTDDVELLDGLARRPLLGASFSPADPAQLPAETGVDGGLTVHQVTGEGSFQPEDFRPADVLTALGGEPTPDMPALGAAVGAVRAGQTTTATVVRDGRLEELEIELVGRPLIGLPGLHVEYGAVEAEGALRRTMLSLPPGEGPHPAVLVVQGVGCYSLESGLGREVYGDVAQHLGERGLAVLRVEKSGMGDSLGEACSTIDFSTALAGYRAGLDALLADPRVDPERVFLFGHSMGGLIGPLLAAETPLAGLMVYGTGVGNWISYELVNLQDQALMWGTPPEQVETALRQRLVASYELLVNKRTAEDILAESPELAPYLNSYPMSHAFFQELYDVDEIAAWKQVEAPVLVMWGTTDFVAKQHSHQLLADFLEGWRPGSATHREIDGADHHMRPAATIPEAAQLMQQPGYRPIHPQVYAEIDAWLDAQLGS